MSLRRLAKVALVSSLVVSAQAAWFATGPYGGEAEIVRSVPRQSGLIIAATRGGLFYYSTNGGASWNHRYFPAQLSGILHALEVDPRSSGVWYAGVESENARISGIYKTSDGGNTWTQLAGMTGKAVWSLALWAGGPDVVAAGTADGVFLSKDAGSSWSAISPAGNRELRPVVSLAIHPRNSAIIYAGTTHLPWRTRDGGAHWESIHSGMIDDSDVFSIAIDANSPSTVFSSACSGVYRSVNGGNSWKRLETPRGAFRAYLVAPNPKRPEVVFAATSAGLLRSTNGGAAWKTVSPYPVKSIAFHPSSPDTVYFASSTAGLMLSHDGGNTIREFNVGFSNRNFSAFTGSGEVLYASTMYEPGSGGIFRSGDLGLRWQRMADPGGDDNIVRLAAAPDNPDHVFAAGYRGLYRSTDGARTWVREEAPANAGAVNTVLALPKGALLMGTANGLFRFREGAWAAVGLPGGRRAVETLQSSGDGAVAALTPAAAFVSDNGGTSWSRCGQPAGDAAWYGLAFAPADGTALAATSVGLFRSSDRCATWQAALGGLDRGTVGAVLFHPRRAGEALAVQYGQVFCSTDGGRSWRPLNERNDAYPSALLVVSGAPQRLFALFPRRGILSMPIDIQPTSRGGD